MQARFQNRFMSVLLALVACLALTPSAASAAAPSVQTTWRLLDYIAVDYAEAVSDGKIVNAAEYAEMREFSASVAEQLAALPAKPDKPNLIAASARLRAAIERKAP